MDWHRSHEVHGLLERSQEWNPYHDNSPGTTSKLHSLWVACSVPWKLFSLALTEAMLLRNIISALACRGVYPFDPLAITPRPHFYQTRSAWSMDQDQIKITLLSTISPLQLPNFVSCGRDKPSHMTQNLVTVGTKLWTADRFLVDPWSMDQADLVW